jgi:hypothetical protein
MSNPKGLPYDVEKIRYWWPLLLAVVKGYEPASMMPGYSDPEEVEAALERARALKLTMGSPRKGEVR